MTYLFDLIETGDINDNFRVVDGLGKPIRDVFDITLSQLTQDGWEVVTMCPRSGYDGYAFLLRKLIH